MSRLPLKAQIAIRDHWDKEDCRLQVALAKLRELVGYDVSVDPEWPLILADLDKLYPDKGNLVAFAAGVVEVWAKSLTELLEDEANEEWTDTLLERLKAWSRIRLFLDVAGVDNPSTYWSRERNAFVVNLPKKHVSSSPTEFYAVFRDSLLECFKAEKSDQALGQREGLNTAADDWADVEMNKNTGKPDVVKAAHKADILPSADALARPDELLLRPPYFLTVSDHGRQRIEVHSSHTGSLRVIAEYLERWCRVNHNDTRNPPAVDVTLDQSPWGLGMMFDRLSLSTENTRYSTQFTVNPCIILALVEGVLGYQSVSVGEHKWTYRRDIEFK